MASLFKIKIVRYVDDHGRRVKKDAPGARAKTEESTKWYGEYSDACGITRRVPLFADKSASQIKLADIVKNVERQMAGIADPFEQHSSRTLLDHLMDYEQHLRSKSGTEEHVKQVIYRIRRIAEACKFHRLDDVDGTRLANWLAERRRTVKRFSAQTSNFYLDGMKYFCNWCVTHGRTPRNPVAMISRINVAVDRRHDRRSLSDDEFQRLIAAAEQGGVVEGISGPDRAMMYILAAWTGYRRREISSLTRVSLDLLGPTPSIRLVASYSKRRKLETIPLHPYVVERLTNWLETKQDIAMDEPLFPLRTAKGFFKKTAKMMQVDLGSARNAWIDEAESPEDQARRKASGFLAYQDEQGLFADFHANRHTFISNLSRAGIPLAMAQKLARHSDPRLTANRYTHLELEAQATAINSLPAPLPTTGSSDAVAPQDSARDGKRRSVAGPVAGISDSERPSVTAEGSEEGSETSEPKCPKSLNDKTLGTIWHQESTTDRVHPSGLEPLTFGSVDRCSIQLS